VIYVWWFHFETWAYRLLNEGTELALAVVIGYIHQLLHSPLAHLSHIACAAAGCSDCVEEISTSSLMTMLLMTGKREPRLLMTHLARRTYTTFDGPI